jgi:hypothetical protein
MSYFLFCTIFSRRPLRGQNHTKVNRIYKRTQQVYKLVYTEVKQFRAAMEINSGLTRI